MIYKNYLKNKLLKIIKKLLKIIENQNFWAYFSI